MEWEQKECKDRAARRERLEIDRHKNVTSAIYRDLRGGGGGMCSQEEEEGLDPCAVETAQEEDVLSVACAPYMIGLEYTGVSPVLLGQARILR